MQDITFRKTPRGIIAIATSDGLRSKPCKNKRQAEISLHKKIAEAELSDAGRLHAGFSMLETSEDHAETWDSNWTL
jgi:hypothetical protein